MLEKKWNFDRDKKELYKIVTQRDGAWCRLCGRPGRSREDFSGLTLHHLASRGTTPANLLIKNSYYRDDPRNLVFLCWECHQWTERNKEKANRLLKTK